MLLKYGWFVLVLNLTSRDIKGSLLVTTTPGVWGGIEDKNSFHSL